MPASPSRPPTRWCSARPSARGDANSGSRTGWTSGAISHPRARRSCWRRRRWSSRRPTCGCCAALPSSATSWSRRVTRRRCTAWPVARPSCWARTSTSTTVLRLIEHAALGAVRWVAPVDLPLEAIGLATRLLTRCAAPTARRWQPSCSPSAACLLAFSARCFTARHHRLSKDECDFRCLGDADGLLLASSEGQPFLVLNGTQTQSAATQCLLGEAAALRAAGVSRLRLSPCSRGFLEAVARFDRVINHGASAAEALHAIEALVPAGGLSNGFAHRRPGLEWRDA